MIDADNVLSIINDVSGDVSVHAVRKSIIDLEDRIRAELDIVEMPVRQMCAGGIYARELFIPKGTVLTGRMYLIDHIDFMVFGDMTVTSDEGSKRVSGYNILPSTAGKKRAGYAHEDTLWVTFCTTEENTEDYYLEHIAIEDSDKYEQALISRRILSDSVIRQAFQAQSSYKMSDYSAFKSGYLLALNKITKDQADRLDFALMAKEIGVSEDTIQSETVIDNVLDNEYEGIFLSDSPINGTGVFTRNTYSAGSDIMPAMIGNNRTIAGRYINHSIKPNAIFTLNGSDMLLKSTKPISNEEITIDYRESYKMRVDQCQVQ